MRNEEEVFDYGFVEKLDIEGEMLQNICIIDTKQYSYF